METPDRAGIVGNRLRGTQTTATAEAPSAPDLSAASLFPGVAHRSGWDLVGMAATMRGRN
jgi:hypothetical protein